ncbi:hypothetical protein BDQ17DRAFT_1262463, partial [Cyathus striatus]
LMQDWTSSIYAFYHSVPTIEYFEGHQYHEFWCYVKSCGKMRHQYLNMKDAGLTGNMHKYAHTCWGEDTVKLTMTSRTADNGSIAAAFCIKGKGIVTYSHRQHMHAEAHAEIVDWVSESNHPFCIVEDSILDQSSSPSPPIQNSPSYC